MKFAKSLKRKFASVSSLMQARVVTCAAAALSLVFSASAATFTYNDLTVEYTNGDLVWLGEAPNLEPTIVYSNATATGTLVLPGKATARMLLVGGGGAGGTSRNVSANGGGGGGGAGGFLETNGVVLAAGAYTITVGAGGVNTGTATTAVGADGASSIFTDSGAISFEAFGGGGGGAMSAGSNGGSGGGGSAVGTSGAQVGGKPLDADGTPVDAAEGTQGFAGGTGSARRFAGGGGGAGGVGGNSGSSTQVGGPGKTSYIISDEGITYAGGGAGGRNSGTASSGGSGGGGAGGSGTGTAAKDGIDGLGAGGGGSGATGNGGKGGDGIVIVRLQELVDTLADPPTMPADAKDVGGVWEIEWDNHEHIIYNETSLSYTLLGTSRETNPGDYDFTVTLNEGFTWKGKTGTAATEPITVYWRIAQATNYIHDLTIKRWEVGALPNVPTCTKRWGTVNYTYRLKSAEDVEESYSATPPSEEGEYVVRAKIAETARWEGAEAQCEFIVFTGALNTYTEYVSLEITPDSTATLPLVNFPVKVTLRENVPFGFSHESCIVDGVNTLRFYDEATGEPLSYSNETWNVNGESVCWVKVPEITASGTKILIYWGLKEGKTPVPVDESTTWESYTRDLADAQQGAIASRTFGLVTNAAEQKSYNYFTTLPSMSRTNWYLGDGEQGVVTSVGVLADGAVVTNWFQSRYTGEVYDEMPTVAGAYVAIFSAADMRYYYEHDALPYKIEFMIRDRSPETDISGNGGDNGRVLIMNDDPNELCPVANQGYRSTSMGNSTWWDFDESEDSAFSSSTYPNLQKGYSFYLRRMGGDGEILWNLVNCRQGNTYRGNTLATGTVGTENYLPWDPDSRRITSTLKVGSSPNFTGTLVMRNMTEACVYSKCFNDGIGTIYFDVVNQLADASAENSEIMVMIATKSIYNEDPTDQNVELTNGYQFAKWEPAKAYVMKHTAAAGWTLDQNGVTNITLTMQRGNPANSADATNNFYRVYVPVNFTGPARFKIQRTKAYPTSEFLADEGGFIIMDNIIASPPPMRAELVPYGTNDTTKVGKQLTGWAGAWTVPFPGAADELYARGKVSAYTNALAEVTDVAKLVTSAKMHYRWRYLEQRAKPSFGSQWYSVELNPGSGFTAFQPLDLPGTVGDVEFYFTGTVQAPYYKYVDYSGTGYGMPLGYTEEQTDFKSGWSDALQANSKARADWFVRLREGESKYEGLKVEYRFRGTGEALTNDMEIVGNHTWRGYVQTPTNMVGRFDYRIVAMNLQEDGAVDYALNSEIWTDVLGTNDVPVSGSLEVAAGEESWSTITNDAKTGYLMFQVDDRTKGLTIVHADYQDFNKWNDAAANELQLFVGRSDNGDDRVGVSAEQRTCTETFDSWRDMPAFSQYWTLTFPTGSQFRVEAGYPPYETFPDNTYNGWDIDQGMWVAQEYRDVSTGAALQMEGCGRGGFRYVQTPAPRGIDAISFNARLGQSIAFDDFCYYDAGARERATMTNYTFTARVAFDGKRNEAYRGNASLSLVAHYTPGRGCYEARWEQIGEHPKKDGNYSPTVNNAMGNRGQRLCIYRWNVDSTGKYTAQELKAWTNTVVSLQSTSAGYNFQNDETQGLPGRKYLPFFVSVSNTASSVVIWAGVRLGEAAINGNASQAEFTSEANTSWYSVRHIDSSAQRVKNGTYGLVSANCEGVFHSLHYIDDAVGVVGYNDSKIAEFNKPRVAHFNGTSSSCKGDLANDFWYYKYGRMDLYSGDAPTDFGFKASPVSQTLYVSLRDPSVGGSGDGGWTTIWTNEFNSFGTASAVLDFSTNFYSLVDSQIKFKIGGEVDDVRVDVVIDDVYISQWRGDSWANAGQYVNGGLNSIGNTEYDLTNFTFSTAWIKDRGILLSARRTTPSAPSSIKSPLFDDAYGRGSGLGKFSFSYSNAQENAVLLLQIATNVNYTMAYALDQFNDSLWHTISNFDFSVFTEEERVSGSRTVYTGLHGIDGMFRLVVDPGVVEAVADNISDTSRFGEVLVTEVSCTDEPAIDERAWWGWNIRSVGQDAEGDDIDWERWNGQSGCNSEGRTYLPDFSENLGLAGRSMALNNSFANPAARILPDGESDDEEIVYRRHMPFVQSPTFTDDIVGEVSFKARKFKTTYGSKPALLVLYGARKGHATDGVDASWTRIQDFSITNDAFETYTYKTPPGGTYSAFRLAIPLGEEDPQRAIIDEFLVCEAVRPNVKFRNVGAFRNHISEDMYVANVPSVDEQPLCNESWGVQCEVYAAQLPDEIDLTVREPKVYLSWFKGQYPWGYDAWKVLPGAKRVQLPPASDSNLVFRSTNLGRGDSVIPASTVAGEVVQYMLEVVYYNKSDLATPITNRLDDSMWRVPGWFSPLDFNADPPGGSADGGFAAFNVLDTVAPGWAWINEVNIYGAYDAVSDLNTDEACQYVEVAAPVESALDGWTLRFLERNEDAIVTNVAATFGTENLPAIKDAAYSASNMSFHVIASPLTNNKKELRRDNGTLDGVWTVEPARVFGRTGAVSEVYPFAIQLVRPSGIIEHEIIVSGTNLWAEYQGYAEMGDINREAVIMNGVVNSTGKKSNFFGAGYDNGPVGASLGVFESHGEDAEKWNNTMGRTPGRINHGQQIPNEHPLPHGEEVFIYANLDPSLPHVRQTFGDIVNSNANTFIVFRKGSPYGTNIVYTVDRWYELGSVTTNGRAAVFTPLAEPRTYTVEVGKGVSNNVTVVASAAITPRLIDAGLDPNDRYTPAILDWLEKGVDLYGNPWANPDSEEISLAQFVRLDNVVVTNLSLREMYWLDIDPTISNMYLKGGWSAAPMRKDVAMPEYAGTATATNDIMSMYMCISNDSAASGYAYWPPYALRGQEPGSHSLYYNRDSGYSWTNATFKIRGIIVNGKTDLHWNSDNWVALRWFVFNENSFYPVGHEKECQSRIEITDPRSSESPGSTAGWDKYNYSVPLFYSWSLDTQRQPIEVEPLKKESTYE